jgi:hypothetical protein
LQGDFDDPQHAMLPNLTGECQKKTHQHAVEKKGEKKKRAS